MWMQAVDLRVVERAEYRIYWTGWLSRWVMLNLIAVRALRASSIVEDVTTLIHRAPTGLVTLK